MTWSLQEDGSGCGCSWYEEMAVFVHRSSFRSSVVRVAVRRSVHRLLVHSSFVVPFVVHRTCLCEPELVFIPISECSLLFMLLLSKSISTLIVLLTLYLTISIRDSPGRS